MKKIMVIALCTIFALGVSTASFAIELTGTAPGSYAKVKGGEVVFGKKPTAYSPAALNRILNAYGVSLNSGDIGGIRAVNFASVKDGSLVFSKKATAYSPNIFHTILTAYGNENGKLFLTLDAAKALIDPPNYVKVTNDDKLAFGKKATAYNPEELNMLLGAYQLPEAGAPPPPTPPVVKEDPIVPPPPPPPPPPPEPEPEPYVEPPPVVYDEGGCSDEDGDGVCDSDDQCPGTPAGAFVDSRGCWIIQNLLFDLNKAVIKRQYYSDLDRVVEVLRDNPYMSVRIEGHTCDLGGTRYNQKLSERRAKAVRDYFLKRGIDPSRLTWVGYGETRRAFPDKDPESRRMNRRVELTPAH